MRPWGLSRQRQLERHLLDTLVSLACLNDGFGLGIWILRCRERRINCTKDKNYRR